MNTGLKIGIIIGLIVIGIALSSPLFYDVEVDEPLPLSLNDIEEDLTYEKFTTMNNDDRKEIVEKMPEELKEMVMEKASTMIVPVSETMDEVTKVFAEKIGKPDLGYVQFSVEDAKKGMMDFGMSDHVSDQLIELNQAINDSLFAVNQPRTAKNTTGTSIEEFADFFAEAYENS